MSQLLPLVGGRIEPPSYSRPSPARDGGGGAEGPATTALASTPAAAAEEMPTESIEAVATEASVEADESGSGVNGGDVAAGGAGGTDSGMAEMAAQQPVLHSIELQIDLPV